MMLDIVMVMVRMMVRIMLMMMVIVVVMMMVIVVVMMMMTIVVVMMMVTIVVKFNPNLATCPLESNEQLVISPPPLHLQEK